MTLLQFVAAILFAIALIHTFAAPFFARLAHRYSRHEGLLHLLGEVEVVFGFWACILIIAMALIAGGDVALDYAESRHYTEPLFVFVIMVIAASRPVLEVVRAIVSRIARLLPMDMTLARVWLCLWLVPLIGSLITEPAAMTLAALMLAPLVFRSGIPEWLKYASLGVLFVNVSIGGTLTAFAAPPVLMVAAKWGWDSSFMFLHFGWKAGLAVLINASVVSWLLRRHLIAADAMPSPQESGVPRIVCLIHLAFLAGVVFFAHHPVIFLGLFLFFLGFTKAYARYQAPLLLKEALLVGFFLAGLVVLGGMQQWWLQPIVANLEPTALFFGALALTAITDNAALTYLGSLVEGMSEAAKYMLMAGAVAGGGLTVIANAPNPAGLALLRGGFRNGVVTVQGLLLGAVLPTAIGAMCLLML